MEFAFNLPVAGVEKQDGREKGIHSEMTKLIKIRYIKHSSWNGNVAARKAEP
jgi:hypothetical protein